MLPDQCEDAGEGGGGHDQGDGQGGGVPVAGHQEHHLDVKHVNVIYVDTELLLLFIMYHLHQQASGGQAQDVRVVQVQGGVHEHYLHSEHLDMV